MNLKTFKTREELGLAAGTAGIEAIKTAIAENGEVNIILATGQSQFETLATLVAATDIDWGKVRMFHLDEYIGIPVTHKASFRKYLTERFLNLVAPLKEVVLINGEGDPQAECERLDKKIGAHPIDVAFVGIGENGHLAFNDPPADFDASGAYLVVNLDTQCRQQQLGEDGLHRLTKFLLRLSVCLFDRLCYPEKLYVQYQINEKQRRCGTASPG
ncbi:6-phosphogluconolactonase [Sphingobacterium sp. E70]|uniref:6-phosphogluconolactonase n=1 Tax=Sphingobacterium sp. E70 TaxID=2853439 RepID=UPI00211BE274|nr:6-phosphogluconolactonase [Sphingobacterium sp. E70]ULT25573.1 6-phosphogluconolactonase [Sphingobacterium sp. E70]